MSESNKKQKITIEVDPAIAVVTLGLFRGYLPSLIETFQNNVNSLPVDVKLHIKHQKEMIECLDEIYEQCIRHTDIRVMSRAIMLDPEEIS